MGQYAKYVQPIGQPRVPLPITGMADVLLANGAEKIGLKQIPPNPELDKEFTYVCVVENAAFDATLLIIDRHEVERMADALTNVRDKRTKTFMKLRAGTIGPMPINSENMA